MDLKDYLTLALSIIALAVSAYSLHVSRQTAQFSQRAKGIELRTLLFERIGDALATLMAADERRLGLLNLAEAHSNVLVYKRLQSVGMTTELVHECKTMRNKVMKVPAARALDVYESLQPDVEELVDRCEHMQKDLEKVAASIEKTAGWAMAGAGSSGITPKV